jgi:2-succinyl-6-hydroxy-2,4-cyclohexadiene-1-carboxylate synthase
VDLPGHGESPLPLARGRDGWEETLAALQELLEGGLTESAGAGPINLLGYSQGARVALGLALRAPGRIRRLILESANPGLKRGQERSARMREDEALAVSIQADGVAAFIDRWEARPFFEGLRRLPEEARAALRARRQACTAEGLAGALRCLGLGVQPSYWAELHRLHVPTLLLTGACDTQFTEMARRMSADLRLSWRKTLDGCWHAPHLEAPEDYADEVLAFLRSPDFSTEDPQQEMHRT